jgi:hypothetical protein
VAATTHDTIQLEGYREFLRACDRGTKETKKEVRGTFREVGEIVRVDWATNLGRFGAKTSTGLRTRVRQRGVEVEQTRRKTTGQHPEFGRHQQRIGEAVLAVNADRVNSEMDQALDRVADHFDDHI